MQVKLSGGQSSSARAGTEYDYKPLVWPLAPGHVFFLGKEGLVGKGRPQKQWEKQKDAGWEASACGAGLTPAASGSLEGWGLPASPWHPWQGRTPSSIF